MSLNYSDLVAQLPRRIRSRFESIGQYVDFLLAEDEERLPKDQRLKRADIQPIKLAAFLFSLEYFLEEGTRAAVNAVDELNRLGMKGFQVGSSSFEGRNENVTRGATLARTLREALEGSDLAVLLRQSSNLPDLVRRLRRKVRHEQGLV